MILYHSIWDIVYVFGVNMPWYSGVSGRIWQQSICWTFILVSGFCWSIGKKHIKTGIKTILCSVAISVITYLFMPDDKIVFGVLWFLGTASIIMIPLDIILKRINPYVCVVVSFLIFLITKNIPFRYIGVGDYVLFDMPEKIYINTFTAYLGFPGNNFFSTDYFPLIPWLLLYICGYGLYMICKNTKLLKYLKKPIFAPIEWLGKYSLWIYMIHQPILYGILYMFFNI